MLLGLSLVSASPAMGCGGAGGEPSGEETGGGGAASASAASSSASTGGAGSASVSSSGTSQPPADLCALATLGDGAYCSKSLDPASRDETTLYWCKGTETESTESCEHGCAQMPDGTNDTCAADPNGPALPPITIHADGMHFTEAEIRPAIESGVQYMLQRMATHAGTGGLEVTPITITYGLWGNGYCGGYAQWDSTEISCPWDYPVEGDNQNYVVNITMHEIGHMLAAQLLGSPDASDRDLCENEGIASWIAGKYWMNVSPATAVGSLREAALADIGAGKAWVSMSSCNSASDAWYTVYASFFEYLEKNVPGGVHDVGTGAVSQWDHVDGWAAWMGQ